MEGVKLHRKNEGRVEQIQKGSFDIRRLALPRCALLVINSNSKQRNSSCIINE